MFGNNPKLAILASASFAATTTKPYHTTKIKLMIHKIITIQSNRYDTNDERHGDKATLASL